MSMRAVPREAVSGLNDLLRISAGFRRAVPRAPDYPRNSQRPNDSLYRLSTLSRLWTAGRARDRVKAESRRGETRVPHCPQPYSPTIKRSDFERGNTIGPQLFSPSSRVRFDRRDPDRRVARRLGPVSGGGFDRACLSARQNARAT